MCAPHPLFVLIISCGQPFLFAKRHVHLSFTARGTSYLSLDTTFEAEVLGIRFGAEFPSSKEGRKKEKFAKKNLVASLKENL